MKKPAVIPSGAVRTASGLTYLITQKGTGTIPKVGDAVAYHYIGTFTNGVKFDSSYEHPDKLPLVATVGVGEVIKGMDEVLSKLRVGDRAIVVLPPEIAYGARGFRDLIAPNSTLIFVVDIIEVKGISLTNDLRQTAEKNGLPAIITRYRELKKSGFPGYYVSEADLNRAGYGILRGKNIEVAIELFKLIVEEYPASANANDSLGEAYALDGQKQLAIESYEKALTLDPKFPSAIKALEKLRAEP